MQTVNYLTYNTIDTPLQLFPVRANNPSVDKQHKHAKHRLSEYEIRAIIVRFLKGYSIQFLSERYKVTPRTIRTVLSYALRRSNKRWKLSPEAKKAAKIRLWTEWYKKTVKRHTKVAYKLTIGKVYKIRKLLHKGIKQKEIAQRFGITPQMVSQIKTRRAWHIPNQKTLPTLNLPKITVMARYLTVNTVAKLYQRSPQWIINSIHIGGLKGFKENGHWYVYADTLPPIPPGWTIRNAAKKLNIPLKTINELINNGWLRVEICLGQFIVKPDRVKKLLMHKNQQPKNK